MQLNATSINARSVNSGAARSIVHADSDFISGILAGLDGIRVQMCDGVAVAHVNAEMDSGAIRMGRVDLGFVFGASLAQTVTRSGRGDAVLDVDASLYYMRTQYGYGSAEISLLAFADVGVVFIDGEAQLQPLIPEIELSRMQLGAGDGVIEFSGDFEASAIRHAPMVVEGILMSGELDASHISGGVLYVGGYGSADIDLVAEDAGMRRQAHIGSADFIFSAYIEPRIERPTLAGEAVMHLLVSGDFLVSKFFHAMAPVEISGAMDGEVIVQGSGSAAIVIEAVVTGYKTTHVSLSSAVTAIEASMDGLRAKPIAGDAPVSFDIESSWSRVKVADGTAIIEILEEATGYLNTRADDDEDQVFSRPAMQREFSRPAAQRDWSRS